MSDAVLVDIIDGIADVRLNRPEAMNALNDDLFAALIDTGQWLRSEPGLRAVVLSGEGRGFCAGLDTSSFSGQTSGARLVPADVDGDPNRSGDLGVDGLLLGRGQKAVWVWRLIPVPVIAALHGAAVGGGLQVALGADLRYATPDAKLGLLEINWGLVADMGGTQLLAALIGLDHARDLIYSPHRHRVRSGGYRSCYRGVRRPAVGREGLRPPDRGAQPAGDPQRQGADGRRGSNRPSQPAGRARGHAGDDRITQSS
jgi:enoyl-CoA hydratase/carnithine racemase